MVAKNAALEKHISLLIKSQQQVQSKSSKERETMQKEITKLKNRTEENLKLIVLLTQKVSRKKTKIINLKRQIEMCKKGLSGYSKILSECKREVEIFKEETINNMSFLRGQVRMLIEKLKQWEDAKLLFTTPQEIQDLIKQREFFKGIVFPVGNKYLADNICKLQIILKEKTEQLSSLENNKLETERDQSDEIKCPYKKHLETLETQAEEYKAQIGILEKKEKLLNKMFTSNVFST